MNRGVAREFGMERSGQDFVLLHQCRFAIVFGKNCDSGSDLFDDRAADEDHFQRIRLERGGTEEDVAGDLAAVAIAEDGHVEELERVLRWILDVGRQQNRTGAGAEHGAPLPGKFPDGVVKAFFLEKLELCSAFAAGQNQAVAVCEIGDGADFDGVSTELVKHGGVSLEISLDGQDSDFHDDTV